MNRQQTKQYRHLWAIIPPWLIIGAVAILVPLFIVMTLENIDRQKGQTTRLLVEKGASLIRSFEAGARTGIGMRWSGFQLQKLLMETAREPDVDYLIVTDTRGTILADSDPTRLGMGYGLDLDLPAIARSETTAWRQVPNEEGADTFEIYRRFAPTSGPFPGFSDPDRPPPPDAAPPGLVIFVGLDMGPILAAQAEDRRNTIWMAVIFLLIGFAGIFLLLLAQGYRATRSSLSRVKAFSDGLVEHMPMGLIAVDGEGTLTVFNRTAEIVFCLQAEAVLGKPMPEILPERCREIFREMAREGRLIEREIDCPVTGSRILPLEVIATPLTEENGSLLGHVFLFRDLTEVRRLTLEIARSRRMASLGSLAAGVAHEIRNPLSSIKGFAAFFRERHGEIPEEREAADVMIKEVERLNRVISQLLEFARPLAMKLQPTSPRAVIRHTLHTVEGQAREKGIAVEADLPPEMGEIPLDADRMSQVLLNLYLNALAAMEGGGALRVALAPGDDGTVRITIADTGAGIRREDLSRVFDPYFTTKPAGTGLGLPIVQKIVEAHGGEVQIASEPGKGTTVTILLPTRPAAPPPSFVPPSPESGEAPPGNR
ncbi:MAG: ATP-binding protein [Deltaproteobacteria bacterium]|nr:ATP-binding protein [Deltaproteobacteria bacterium]